MTSVNSASQRSDRHPSIRCCITRFPEFWRRQNISGHWVNTSFYISKQGLNSRLGEQKSFPEVSLTCMIVRRKCYCTFISLPKSMLFWTDSATFAVWIWYFEVSCLAALPQLPSFLISLTYPSVIWFLQDGQQGHLGPLTTPGTNDLCSQPSA